MSDSELVSDSILFDGSALDFVLRFSNQSLVCLDSFPFYFPAPFVFLFIYATVTKKILKYSTVNILPPPETSESPEKQSQDTRRLPEQTSHRGERPAGVLLPAGPLAASQHTSPPQYISVSLHLSFPSVFLPPSQKLRSFHNV